MCLRSPCTVSASNPRDFSEAFEAPVFLLGPMRGFCEDPARPCEAADSAILCSSAKPVRGFCEAPARLRRCLAPRIRSARSAWRLG